ncbi:MAG TPA: SIR2 family protein [Thermoanaerobaculia bacterium]|nr:SIR2 family protein [Thermoanaerobaculia bacterium]
MPADVYSEGHLVDQLINAATRDDSREVVFLIGSPLTAPHPAGTPGVPGAAELVNRARSLLRHSDLTSSDMSHPYQAAFRELLGSLGPDEVNRLIRSAVLEACPRGAPDLLERALKGRGDAEACQLLEHQTEAWYLSTAVAALGEIVASFHPPFGGVVLTTNFDPLLEIAIRRAGGRCWSTFLQRDGSLEQSKAEGCHVVHLHGFWYGSDTLHTPAQLEQPRPRLSASLRRLFNESMLVVMAYGGWNDIITQTLVDLLSDGGAFPFVLWGFHTPRPADEPNLASLLSQLRPGIGQGRILLYGGIDCHTFFSTLLQQLQTAVKPVITASRESRSRLLLSPVSVHRTVRHQSPFVVGPEIQRDDDLFGRRPECEALREVVREGRSAQIIGEARMGKSSLLRWVERNAGEWRPVARVNARGRAGRSPGDFIREVAWSLGKGPMVEVLWQEDPPPKGSEKEARLVEEALYTLVPFVLLVDEADSFRSPRHFPGRFFSLLRELCQGRQLSWVSSSQRDLRRARSPSSPISRFLDDASLVSVGLITEDAARQLLKRGLPPAQVDLVVEEAGGFVHLVQFLGHALWDRPRETEAAVDRFAGGTVSVFEKWWSRRTRAEQYLLKRLLRKASPINLTKMELRRARGLVDLGLAVEIDGAFAVPSAAWRKFVALA